MRTSRAPRPSPYLYTATGPHDYREIVCSLVNGVDISLIDPELFGSLLPFIDQYVLKFQDRGDGSAIEKLNFCKSYISTYPERVRVAKLLTRKKPPPQPIPPPFTESEEEEEVSRLMKNDFSGEYTRSQREQLLAALRRRRLVCADAEDFDQADLLSSAATKLARRGEVSFARRSLLNQSEEARGRLLEARQALSDCLQRWREVERGLSVTADEEIEALRESQREARAKLEDEQKGTVVPMRFRKYSNRVQHLRQQEKMLVASKEYEKAAAAQELAKQQEQREDEEITAKYRDRITEEIKKLDEKHKAQVEFRREALEREKRDMMKAKRKETDALKKKIEFLERQAADLEGACRAGGIDPSLSGGKSDDVADNENGENDDKNENNNKNDEISENNETDERENDIDNDGNGIGQRRANGERGGKAAFTSSGVYTSEMKMRTMNTSSNLPQLGGAAENGPQRRRSARTKQQTFRQRALLNNQIYCAKNLFPPKSQRGPRARAGG